VCVPKYYAFMSVTIIEFLYSNVLSKDVTLRMFVHGRTKRGGERILIRMRLFSDAVDEGEETC